MVRGVVPFFAVFLLADSARASAKLKGEKGELDLGAIVQLHTIGGNHDWDDDGRVDRMPRFVARRARIRLTARVGDVTAFLQTDRGDGDGRLGLEYRLIDAWLRVRIRPWLQLQGGIHLAPSSRQNVTLSTALLALDRPALAFKSLTWGTRALGAFATRPIGDTDAGLRPRMPVRDIGWTAFGGGALGERAHAKYFVGVYEGVNASEVRAPRITGRVQLNFLDPEPDYFVSATYLGRKRTIALGASYDTQSAVARDQTRGLIRYELVSVDLFAEHPIGATVGTVEAAFQALSLGGASALDVDRNDATAPRDATRAEGRGGFVQAAVLVGRVQPWMLGEWWNARGDAGSYRAARAGFTYYLDDHNAKVKLGYELTTARGVRWHTALLGLFFWF